MIDLLFFFNLFFHRLFHELVFRLICDICCTNVYTPGRSHFLLLNLNWKLTWIEFEFRYSFSLYQLLSFLELIYNTADICTYAYSAYILALYQVRQVSYTKADLHLNAFATVAVTFMSG